MAHPDREASAHMKPDLAIVPSKMADLPTTEQESALVAPDPAGLAVDREPRSETNLRIVVALLGSAATLVPIPFVDGLLRERISQFFVSRTLRAHGRTYGTGAVKALWADPGGCVSGCFWFVLKLPLTLILFPIRKIYRYVMAAKTVMNDLSRTLLYGRTLDRLLKEGRLNGSPEELVLESTRIRAAFEETVKGFDNSLLTKYLSRALSGVKGLLSVAMRNARRLFRRGQPDEAPLEDMNSDDRQVLEQGQERIRGVLEDPEVIKMLEEFDARFDEALLSEGSDVI